MKTKATKSKSISNGLLTVADVAERLGVSYGRAIQKIHHRATPHERIGGRIYVREAAMAELRLPLVRGRREQRVRREHDCRLRALAAMPLHERLRASASELASDPFTHNVLCNAGFHTVADVARFPEWQWLYVKNCGKATIARIEASLQAIGLRIGMSYADLSARGELV